MTVHRPDPAVAEFGSRAQPLTRGRMPREHLAGTIGYLPPYRRPSRRLEGVEAGATRDVLPAILARLPEVGSGVALAQHPLPARTPGLLVAQLRRLAPLAAIITHQTRCRPGNRLVHHGRCHASSIELRHEDDVRCRRAARLCCRDWFAHSHPLRHFKKTSSRAAFVQRDPDRVHAHARQPFLRGRRTPRPTARSARLALAHGIPAQYIIEVVG